MKKLFTVSILPLLLFVSAVTVYPHLCDNVFRQADSLIVKPETYSLVVKDTTTFKIFLQNNMDRQIAEISLIPESPAFNFTVSPAKMPVPKNRQVYFQVTLSPKPGIKTGNYPVRFRLVGGGREFKSFTLEGLTQERREPDIDISSLSRIQPTTSTPVIDGNFNETAWQGKTILSNFRSLRGSEPAYLTWTLITFDRNNLYLGVFCRDEDMQKLSEQDRLEIIFSPAKEDSSGFIMTFCPEKNPLYQRYDREKQVSAWSPSGIRHSVLKGDRFWSVEIAIPFSSMDVKYPSTRELWDIRITRTKASGTQETSFWATDTTGYHSEKGFGKIVLIP